ncbi:toxin-antitoxin system, toxin component, HipA family [Roseibium sp. TrichSKD4]|nr:toxin-antitoxin system, toxin component, HipA family [Roseibium sp. TrichSKD4]
MWIWLPGKTEPVVAGQVMKQDGSDNILFGYGRSYRRNPDAIPIFDLDLPIGEGLIEPSGGHNLAPSLRDALPDRWGRRVIVNELLGNKREEIDEDAFGEMTFMIRSGSDRIGAIDFQESADEFVPRVSAEATLEELQSFADKIEAGEAVPEVLDRTILHGSSIGGARPKALINDTKSDRPRKLIAKFSAANDVFAMVKGEFATMRLAKLAGLDVAEVEIEQVLDREVLLVERFDRIPVDEGKNWHRRSILSALTWTQETELAARHIAYTELADIMRARFANPKKDLPEFFARLSFNILVGNTDDHARNHAGFWDGEQLSLTPAYDIAPQKRGTGEANQALNITPGKNAAQLVNVLEAAPYFQLSEADARQIIASQIQTIVDRWHETCDAARMASAERRYFEGRQIFNAYAFEGYGSIPQLSD